ncbi:hypothetical protein GQX74_013741, partial [Glossina fuscipes]
ISPLRNHLQQQQQLQLYNAQTIKAAASHHNKLLPFSIAISYSAKYNNHNELAGRTRVNKNLSSQNNMRRSPMLHPPATTATTNQYLHQSQKQRQYEYLTPSRHPHQQQHHHHRHNVRNQQQSPSTTQPAGNSTTGLNLSTDVMVTTTAQCTMINSEFELSTNTDDGSGNDGEPDGSISLTPWDLATEALKDSHPIDRGRLLSLLQRILNEIQHYRR